MSSRAVLWPSERRSSRVREELACSLAPGVRDREPSASRGRIHHLADVLSILRGLLFATIALVVSGQVSMAAQVGSVSKVENQAQVGGTAAAVGTPIQMNDQLRTGPKSKLEVTFADDTKLALGENAQVVVDRYVYNPDKSAGELVLSTSAAAFRLTTGKLNEMRNRNVSVATPVAALAVRGTDFWWGSVDGQYGVLLVNNSAVDVGSKKCDKENRECRCRVRLDKPGEGTDLKNGCPGEPYMWPPGKVAAALASTSFGLALGPSVVPGAAVPAGAALGVLGGFLGSAAANDGNPTVNKLNNGGGGGGGGGQHSSNPE